MTTLDKKETLRNELMDAVGKVTPANPTDAKKVPIMSYSNGQVYIGLKAVSAYDAKTGTHKDPQPRITASFGGHFVELPLDGKWWRTFADFTEKMAQALEGINISVSNVYDDVDNAKKLLAGFRTE
ncbi:MAG: hypothetical protein MJZ68_01585 [archaeon]|nr:hypothetical protein [archaeon]